MLHTENKKNPQNAILLMAVVTAFITTFTGSAINLAVPDIETEFGVSAAMVGWIITAYTLVTAALAVPMGKIADATGRRRILITGVFFFAIFSIFCIFASNIRMLICARILQGIFAAMIFATNNAILVDAFPPSERGKVLGISTAATYTGLSLGPVLGGLMNAYLGWRSIFIITCIVASLSLSIILFGVPHKEEKPSSSPFADIPGAILFILMIVSILYGLTNMTITRYGWSLIPVGILLGILFGIREAKTPDPMLPVTLFTRDAVFTLSNLAALLNYGATFAITYLLSIYLQVVMGYSSEIAGFILIFMPAVQAVCSPITGRLSDRIAPYKLASLGMFFCVIGLLLFSFIGKNTSLLFIVLALTIEGLGFGLFSSPNTNLILSRVSRSHYSIANSILATMRTTGHTASMAIVTIVVGMTLGNQGLSAASPDQLIHTIHIIFHIFILLCLTGTLMSLKRGEPKTHS